MRWQWPSPISVGFLAVNKMVFKRSCEDICSYVGFFIFVLDWTSGRQKYSSALQQTIMVTVSHFQSTLGGKGLPYLMERSFQRRLFSWRLVLSTLNMLEFIVNNSLCYRIERSTKSWHMILFYYDSVVLREQYISLPINGIWCLDFLL